jgi:hypothetical protein
MSISYLYPHEQLAHGLKMGLRTMLFLYFLGKEKCFNFWHHDA